MEALRAFRPSKTSTLDLDDPTAGRPVGGRSSTIQTAFNATNLLLGIGILAYPAALKASGWSGLGVLAFLSLTTRYTAGLLAKIIDLDPDIRSYPDIGAPASVAVGTLIHLQQDCELLEGLELGSSQWCFHLS